MNEILTKVPISELPYASVYNKTMPKKQSFTKLDGITIVPHSLAINDIDIQITPVDGDNIEGTNSSVDMVFTQENHDGSRSIVGSFSMRLKDLKNLDSLIHEKTKNFFRS
jgi:hypothetical protein